MQYATAKAGGDPADATPVTGATVDRNPSGGPRLVYGASDMEQTRQTQATLQVGVQLAERIEARFTLGGWRDRMSAGVRSFLRDASGQPVYLGTVLVDGDAWTLPEAGLAPVFSERTHVLYGAQLDGCFDNDWCWKAVASRYDYQHDIEHDAASSSAGNGQGGPGTMAGMGGSGWSTFDLRASGPLGQDNKLYAGAHFDRYLLDPRVLAAPDWRADATGPLANAYGGRTRTRAAYLQDTWDFAPAWTSTLGLRWEQWHAYRGVLADAATRVAYPARRRSDLSPKASLAWRFAAPWELRLSFGKAVRYPTVEELFQGSLSHGAIINNNPDLRPERDWSTDLSLIRQVHRGHWRVSLFQDRFVDTLYSQTDITLPVPVTNVQNIDSVRVRGIEGALQLQDVLPGVDLDASGAWNQAVTLRDAQYPLADAKLRWRFAPQWTASLGVDNLTNEQYWVYHPYAGRTWFGEVSWNL